MKSASVRQDGYTIIEVIIFLTISSVLLLSVLQLFNGRIQGTQFSQSVQALDSKIRTTANEASTGTFAGSQPFSCTVSSSGDITTNPLQAGEQGTRTNCIFVGKVINFGPAGGNCTDPVAAGQCESTDVYTVVGRRTGSSDGKVSTGLIGATGAKPRIVQTPNLTETYGLGYGTHVTGVYKNTTPRGQQYSAVGFFQSFNSNYDATGNLGSGSQGIEVWTGTNGGPVVSPMNLATAADMVEDENLAPLPSEGVIVCVKSGNNKRKASIALSNAGGVLATNVKIGDERCP